MKRFLGIGVGHPVVALLLLTNILTSHGQGTISFDTYSSFTGTNYYELGMGFHVAAPNGAVYDHIYITEGGRNLVSNSTPFMAFWNQYSANNYVFFGLTNGSSFGLTSVQLADTDSQSYTLFPITFRGYRDDGHVVTETFITPGNGANSLLDYEFTSDFAFGLTRVDIYTGINPAHWAMDNLVFTVPEPGVSGLLVVGLMAFVTRRIQNRTNL
jgi:hypothetical protein